jgi:hypothetical protein
MYSTPSAGGSVDEAVIDVALMIFALASGEAKSAAKQSKRQRIIADLPTTIRGNEPQSIANVPQIDGNVKPLHVFLTTKRRMGRQP